MADALDIPNVFEDDSVVRRFGILCERSEGFTKWLFDQLESYQCHRVLEAACGTGGDSLLLIERGFDVVSSDGSQTMVLRATNVRKERNIENWDIVKANWLTLKKDLVGYENFDAVLCLSSSMICLIDPTPNLALYRQSFENFKSMLKPGGVLLIDHRNMDAIIDSGEPVNKNVYFKKDTIAKMTSEIVRRPGKADSLTVIYDMIKRNSNDGDLNANGYDKSHHGIIERVMAHLQPIRAKKFAQILSEVFGQDCERAMYADFMPVEEVSVPAYYQHVIIKTK